MNEISRDWRSAKRISTTPRLLLWRSPLGFFHDHFTYLYRRLRTIRVLLSLRTYRNTFTASQGSPSIIDIFYTREPVNELCPKIAWAEQPRRTTATEAFDELFTTEKYMRKSTQVRRRWHRLSPTIISRGSLYREIDNHHLTTFYWFIRLWSCWGA